VKTRRAGADDRLYIVGVTGGIASGKSTLVEILAGAMPSVVVDADALGHGVLQRPDVARALAEEFGADVLDEEGNVQRTVLGPRAFASPERLAALDEITRPPLLALVESVLAGCAERAFEGLVVLDAALLVEWDKGEWCDRVVAVTVDPSLRVQRLVRRTGLPRPEAERRVAAQLPDAARAAYADEVIANDGTLEEFRAASGRLAERIAADARSALAARVRLG
jgi:dephospho-CoA kinase